MTQRRFVICFLLLLTASISYSADQPFNDVAPSQAARTARAMKTAGFWISRHHSPDAVIMAQGAIAQLNSRLQNERKLTKDIFSVVKDFKMESLLADFEKALADFAEGYYTAGGLRDDKDLIDAVRRNMHLSGVVLGALPRWGLVAHYARQRFLPTVEGLYRKKADFDFDELQNSALDVGTPVAVVHASRDGQWFYVLTELSDGWVQAKDIALGDITQVSAFAREKDFAVVIKPKADIFFNAAMTDYDDYARMGARLPLAGIKAGQVTVRIPVADKEGRLTVKEAFMNEEDVHPGYLPYTARAVYKQALAMLNQPYGWGDMYGEQDCSRFLQMVYATVGLRLPRDSKDQAQAGAVLAAFGDQNSGEAKMTALKRAPGATTLLAMKGHIMLYLGMVDGVPYAIHATSTYQRVIVSDLSLGEGSPKGSLLKRLSKVVALE